MQLKAAHATYATQSNSTQFTQLVRADSRPLTSLFIFMMIKCHLLTMSTRAWPSAAGSGWRERDVAGPGPDKPETLQTSMNQKVKVAFSIRMVIIPLKDEKLLFKVLAQTNLTHCNKLYRCRTQDCAQVHYMVQYKQFMVQCMVQYLQ